MKLLFSNKVLKVFCFMLTLSFILISCNDINKPEDVLKQKTDVNEDINAGTNTTAPTTPEKTPTTETDPEGKLEIETESPSRPETEQKTEPESEPNTTPPESETGTEIEQETLRDPDAWQFNQTIAAYNPPPVDNLKEEFEDDLGMRYGRIFAPGVTESSGWYDTSKNYKGGAENGDNALCWAFSAANMIQWWLNDYKEFTGEDYPIAAGKNAIPTESVHGYQTPVMDLFRAAFSNEGWLPERGLEWFFRGEVMAGTSSSQNACIVNGDAGNYLGMTTEQAYEYIFYPPVNPEYYEDVIKDPYLFKIARSPFGRSIWLGPKGCDEHTTRRAFSKYILEQLQWGPICIGTNLHAVTIWGAEYRRNNEGGYTITHLYVDDSNTSAVKLDYYKVSYAAQKVTMEGFATGVGDIVTIGATLRAYSTVHGK